MTGQEYLERYKEAYIKAMRLQIQIQAVDDLLGNVTVDPSNERVQATRDPDQIGKLVARRADILADLMTQKAEALEIMQEIYSTIELIDNMDEQLILQLRYIKLLKWDQVEREMQEVSRPYSRQGMFDHHRIALEKIEKIIKSVPDCTLW